MKNLTEQIRAALAGDILAGKYSPGDRLPSEREYAESTGTSRVTVRRAYDQLEAAGIIVRRRPHGTCVADTFLAHSGTLESVGLITTLPHEFSGRFVEAVSRCCRELDALLVLGIPEPDNAQAQLEIAVRMATRGVKDLIVWGADRNFDFRVFERLRILGVNLVFFDQILPGNFADYIGLDNEGAMRALLEKAKADGAKQMIFVNYSDLDVDTNAERQQAFEAYLENSGCRGEIRLISRHASAAECRLFAAELVAAAASMPTAVIGVNAPVLQMLFRHPVAGIRLYCVDHVPQLSELGAVGFRQPIDAMAEAAVLALQEQRKKGGKWRAGVRRFAGELVEP